MSRTAAHNEALGAIVLAAGTGARIGVPKLLLKKGEKTYLESILDNLSAVGISPVVCVVGSQHVKWVRSFVCKPEIAINDHPEQGMISSVQLGVESVQGISGLFIVPVDHPYVQMETYKKMQECFHRHPDAIIKPSYKRQSGHPIIIPKKCFNAIRTSAAGSILSEILKKSEASVHFLEIKDSGVVKNINEMSDIPS